MTEPAALDRYPADLEDLIVGLAELEEARADYDDAHDYMTGDVPEYFASAKLARRVQATGTSFRVNVARKAVTSVTDRLEITNVIVLPTDEDEEGDPSEAAQTLAHRLTTVLQKEVWDRNELALEAPDWHERIGEFGDGYAFVWPSDDWDGTGTPAEIDIHFSGPRSTRAIYDQENPRKIAYVIKHWTVGARAKKRHRVNLYYFGPEGAPDEGRIEKWISEETTEGRNPENWLHYNAPDDPDSWRVPNPFGQIVWHFRTARPYGRPLHKEAYGPQDAINKLLVSLMNTVDFHLIPQRAALTEEAEVDDDDEGDFDDFSDSEDADGLEDPAKRPDGDGKLKTGPGELWILKNVKSLVQLAPADPMNFLKPAEFFMRMMAQVTDQPLHLFDPGGDQPSGDSRRQAEGTLTKKVGRIRELLEATYKGLLAKAMEMLGYADVLIDVRWNPAQQVDDSEGWTTAAAKIEAGVPVGQVLQEMGYESEVVATWLADSDEQDLKRRVALLAAIATLAKDLGAAVSLGVISQEAVDKLLGDLTGEGIDTEAVDAAAEAERLRLAQQQQQDQGDDEQPPPPAA